MAGVVSRCFVGGGVVAILLSSAFTFAGAERWLDFNKKIPAAMASIAINKSDFHVFIENVSVAVLQEPDGTVEQARECS